MDDRVNELLKSIGLEASAARFAEEEIGYDDLIHLGEADLEKMGLKTGPRKRLLAELAKRAAGSSTSTAVAPEAPTEAPAETPTEAPTEAASSDAPSETPSETPSEAPPETPSDGSSETPSDAPTETPSDSSSETPTETPAEEPPPPPEEPPPPPPPPPRVRVSLVPAPSDAWDAATTGWHGETLPKGMKRGAASPVCLWDTGQGIEIAMVYVPAGEFKMGNDESPNGDEAPQHTQNVPAFYIGQHPTTWKEYKAFCKKTSRTMPQAPSWGIKDDHPVVNIPWDAAEAYCAWAGLSLPGEAMWEKAARGPEGYQYPWGDTPPDGTQCLFVDTPKLGGKSTAPVGSFAEDASCYGVRDMAGNVGEWNGDWHHGGAYASYANGEEPRAYGDLRIVRGGCWTDVFFICRTGARGKKFPSFWGETVGVRPALRVT